MIKLILHKGIPTQEWMWNDGTMIAGREIVNRRVPELDIREMLIQVGEELKLCTAIAEDQIAY
jgi:hypothetical protein